MAWLCRQLCNCRAKPWEILYQDTMEMWKSGDHKHYTSLELLAALFNVPSSKSDISSEDVSRVYHLENDLPRIARYCKTDTAIDYHIRHKVPITALK